MALFYGVTQFPVEGKERFNRVRLPEVARDEVICFALYTVHGGVMKMSAQRCVHWWDPGVPGRNLRPGTHPAARG